MFTWICPKCGKEVPPSYSECPNCAAKDQTSTEPAAATPAPAPPRPAPPAQRGLSIPVWIVSLLIAVALIGAGAAFLLLRASKSADSPARPAAALETPSALSSVTAPSNAVTSNLELAGFRLTEDSKQKAVVQFVVVNHSAADLGEIGAKVNLSALNNQQKLQPVGSFVFKTTLGPYESKELKVPVDTKLRVYELPDWQFLRAEFARQ
jgi:hypothetical protein